MEKLAEILSAEKKYEQGKITLNGLREVAGLEPIPKGNVSYCVGMETQNA